LILVFLLFLKTDAPCKGYASCHLYICFNQDLDPLLVHIMEGHVQFHDAYNHGEEEHFDLVEQPLPIRVGIFIQGEAKTLSPLYGSSDPVCNDRE